MTKFGTEPAFIIYFSLVINNDDLQAKALRQQMNGIESSSSLSSSFSPFLNIYTSKNSIPVIHKKEQYIVYITGIPVLGYVLNISHP